MAEKNKEYASMYFGFTPSAFSDNVFNAGNESICANLKKFRKEFDAGKANGILWELIPESLR